MTQLNEREKTMVTKKHLNKTCLVSLSLADLRAAGACSSGVEFFKSIAGESKKLVNTPWSPLIEIAYRTNREAKNFIGWAIVSRLFPGHSFDGADLRNVNLSNGNFVEVDFEDANMRNCDLFNSSFERACLRGANLKHANLEHANFSGADLQGADLSKAKIDCYTSFSRAKINNYTKFPKKFNLDDKQLIPMHLASYATNETR